MKKSKFTIGLRGIQTHVARHICCRLLLFFRYDALACGDLDVQWPEAEDEKEREELLAKVHQRRIQGKINREGAMLARQMKTKRNKELVLSIT